MPIEIAPKQQIQVKNAYNGRKKQHIVPALGEHGKILNRKVVLIKRSKSTGIVLKQKKQNTANIKHHPKPVSGVNGAHAKHILPEITKQSNLGAYILPSDKPYCKDGKVATASQITAKLAPKKILNSETTKSSGSKHQYSYDSKDPLCCDKVSSLLAQKKLDNRQLASVTIANNTAQKQDGKLVEGTVMSSSTASSTSINNSIFSNKRDSSSQTDFTENGDANKENLNELASSADCKATHSTNEKLALENSHQPSLKLVNTSCSAMKNGLHTPPVSTINTTTNSDVEVLLAGNNDLNDPILQNWHTENKNTATFMNEKNQFNEQENNNTNLKINKENGNTSAQKDLKNQDYLKQQSSTKSNNKIPTDVDITQSLSGLNDSVPMTPSYTTSTDDNNETTFSQTVSHGFLPKSPKEEAIDGTKLSKKASWLKKKIVHRKNKNNVLKLELNDLIENLQMLKKQYDMISTVFKDDTKSKSHKIPPASETLLNLPELDLMSKKLIGEKNAKPVIQVKNEIPGYYYKRTGDMLYADDKDMDLSDCFPQKKRKKTIKPKDNSNIFMSNINLITDNILSNVNSTLSGKNNSESDIAVNLLSIQDVLQQPDPEAIDLGINFNDNDKTNNSLFNERNNNGSNFDFFLDNGENINLDDDVNMDFLNF